MRIFGTPNILKRLVPRGLLGRSLLILVVPILLLQAVTSYIFYTRHWDTVMRRLADGIAGEVGMIIDLLQHNPENTAWVVDTAGARMQLALEILPDQVLPNTQQTINDSALEQAMARSLSDRVRRPYSIRTGILEDDLIIQVQLADSVLKVTASRKRLFSSTTYILVLWMVGTALILVGIATVFMSNQVRSIRRLAASADGFGKGRDLPPIKPEGAREVRQAAHAFNIMRDRIRGQLSQRTEMLAGVSHDLRTPLTRMKLQLAMMADSPEAPDLAQDVSEMERMIEGYLAFARGEGTEAVREDDLVALIADVCSRFLREGVLLEVAGLDRPPLFLPLRHGAMERCISNLIVNATRYGTRVRLTVSDDEENEVEGEGKAIVLTVEDDGPGIPPEQREDVFRAFWRAEGSRNPRTGGTGLGLTIARDVARAHGGDIFLGDSPEMGGLKATVRIPL